MADLTDVPDLLRDLAQRHGVIGAQLGVLVDDVETLVSCGLADAEAGAPMTDSTTMPIASVTKPMVATVVADLVQAGRIGLDDSVADVVPELASSGWANDATIRDLLANTSGVPLRVGREFAFESEGDDAFALYADEIARDPALTKPGQVWGYSNTGWNLLGRVIEVVTGARWEDAMTAQLFQPLGMGSTRFFRDANVVSPSQRYDVGPGGRQRAAAWTNRANGPGGAGLWSSAADLIRFARSHVDTDVHALLRELHATPPTSSFLDGWCLGWARFDYEGGQVWGWDGIGPGHRAVLRFVPGRGALALLTNTSTGRDLYRSLFPELLDRCFGIHMRPAMAGLAEPSLPLESFTGTYSWLDSAVVVGVSDAGELTFSQGGDAALERLGDCTFVMDRTNPADSTVTFAELSDGRAELMYFLVWPYPRTA